MGVCVCVCILHDRLHCIAVKQALRGGGIKRSTYASPCSKWPFTALKSCTFSEKNGENALLLFFIIHVD